MRRQVGSEVFALIGLAVFIVGANVAPHTWGWIVAAYVVGAAAYAIAQPIEHGIEGRRG